MPRHRCDERPPRVSVVTSNLQSSVTTTTYAVFKLKQGHWQTVAVPPLSQVSEVTILGASSSKSSGKAE